MRKVVFYIMFVVGVSLLSSCETLRDMDAPLAVPPLELTFHGDQFTMFYKCNGDTLRCSYEVDVEEMPSNMEIEKVEFFLSNKKIGESSNLSYLLEYVIEDRVLGDHELKIVIVADGDGYQRNTLVLRKKYHIVETIPVYGFDIICPEVIENGKEYLYSFDLSDATTLELEIEKVVFSFDDESFYTATSAPYSVNKTFSVQSLGKHKFSFKVYYNLPVDDYSGVLQLTKDISIIN